LYKARRLLKGACVESVANTYHDFIHRWRALLPGIDEACVAGRVVEPPTVEPVHDGGAWVSVLVSCSEGDDRVFRVEAPLLSHTVGNVAVEEGFGIALRSLQQGEGVQAVGWLTEEPVRLRVARCQIPQTAIVSESRLVIPYAVVEDASESRNGQQLVRIRTADSSFRALLPAGLWVAVGLVVRGMAWPKTAKRPDGTLHLSRIEPLTGRQRTRALSIIGVSHA